MKFKEFFIAFGLSCFLGYLYISGRFYIDGKTFSTGYDYIDLNFDFSDYTYWGFIANLFSFFNHLNQNLIILFIIILVCLFFFIFKPQIKKTEIRFEYFMTVWWKKYIKKDKELDKDQILSKIEDRINERKPDLFSKYLLFSYFSTIISIFTIYAALLIILKFNQQGSDSSKVDVLESKTYITYENRPLFKVLCGKTQCIYADKGYTYFKKIKEENYEPKNLEKIQLKSKRNDFSIYLIDSKMINPLEKIIYVQIDYNKGAKINLREINYFDFRLHTKNLLPLRSQLSFEKTCYSSFNDEYVNKINEIKVKDNKEVPYFLAFKVPIEKDINYIQIFNPSDSLKEFNSCK